MDAMPRIMVCDIAEKVVVVGIVEADAIVIVVGCVPATTVVFQPAPTRSLAALTLCERIE